MRKLLICIFGILFFQLGFSQDFTVENAEIEIFINEDGYFDVIEKYDVFFEAEKHGIYRTIQTRNEVVDEHGNVETRKIGISKIKVPGEKFSKTPLYQQDLSGEIVIKIGSRFKTISGPKHYEIQYRVYNAFLYEDSSTHFYWNIKSNQWLAQFHGLEFKIHPPKNASVSLDDFFVYSGRGGNEIESNEFEIRQEGDVFVVKSLPNFNSNYGESVTALLKLPVGSIKKPSSAWVYLSYLWVLILGGGLLGFYAVWIKYGKDDKVPTTTSYFAPKGIDPPMAGYLINDKADANDLMSLLPYWGAEGIIKMEHIPKKGIFSKEDTKLIKMRALPLDVPEYEQQMFDGLFSNSREDVEESVLVSSLKDAFYTTMNSAKKSLKDSALIYYEKKSEKIKLITTIAIVVLGLGIGYLFLHIWGIVAGIAVIPVVIVLLILSQYMSKRNRKGNDVLTELRGFQQFIKISEENQLRMLVKEDPNYFEKTMAYALALGLFKQWAKKFEALNVPPPSWYSTPIGVSSMNNFSNSFSKSISATQSNMISSPSSSGSGGIGGGSAGGGFGGGGGGSW